MKKFLLRFILPLFIAFTIYAIFIFFYKDNSNNNLAPETINRQDETVEYIENENYDKNEEIVIENSDEDIDEGNIIDEENNNLALVVEPEKPKQETLPPLTYQKSFVQCLYDAGVVIYGSYTCPACAQLAEELGGYSAIGLIYVECNDFWERCEREMKTAYVPEVQIKGVLFEDWATAESLSKKTGCKIL